MIADDAPTVSNEKNQSLSQQRMFSASALVMGTGALVVLTIAIALSRVGWDLLGWMTLVWLALGFGMLLCGVIGFRSFNILVMSIGAGVAMVPAMYYDFWYTIGFLITQSTKGANVLACLVIFAGLAAGLSWFFWLDLFGDMGGGTGSLRLSYGLGVVACGFAAYRIVKINEALSWLGDTVTNRLSVLVTLLGVVGLLFLCFAKRYAAVWTLAAVFCSSVLVEFVGAVFLHQNLWSLIVAFVAASVCVTASFFARSDRVAKSDAFWSGVAQAR